MKSPKPNVQVTTEVGYCPFCGRTRTLRTEERHLGALVRTTVECETCHRTLSSTIGPPKPAEPEPAAEPVTEPEAEPETKPAPAAKPATKPARPRTAAAAKPATKKKTTTAKKK